MELSNSYQSQVTSDGNQIVRTFTKSHEENFLLAAGIKEAQREIDVKTETRARRRKEGLYRDLVNTSDPIQESELVMNALRRASDQFFESVENKQKASKFKGFWKRNQSVESKVEQQMKQSKPQSLDDVKQLVIGMSDEWTKSHGKIYSTFSRICRTLDAHSILFKIVPSQNTYAAVLSGALSMIVQASVYHTEIADNLSRATAHLCERAAFASQLVEVIKKKSMQGELAEVYKQLFLFLLETAIWFNKPGFSRFFDSFNKKVKEEHDVAVSTINDHIDIIAKKGFVEGLLSIEDVRQTGDIIEWKLDLLVPRITNIEQNLETLVDEVRIQGQFQQEQFLSAGYSMRSLLLAQVDSKIREAVDHRLRTTQNAHLVLDKEEKIEVIQGHTLSQPDFMVTREEADVQCRTLRAMVYGTDGIALAQESRPRLVDVNVISRLALWIQEATGRSQKLWIDYPFEFQEDSPARAAALSIISIAARANAPFLSYICRKPRQFELVDSQTPENAGLLSMVYSLILQLLRFRPRDDEFRFDLSMLSKLSGDMSSWDVALGLFSSLLEHTVVVHYCIIHGLNELETGDGAVKCKDLLMVLFSHSHRPESPFSMLFTTSGQSRALYGVIEQRDRASSNDSTRAVDKRGMHLNPMQM